MTMGAYRNGKIDNVVPASDGAGEVEAVGKGVLRFKKGDRVLTLFNQGHIEGLIDERETATDLGGMLHGTLREYGAFHEQGLVHMPPSLTFQQGATLPCAALTAYNALFGLVGRQLGGGHWVLTQGTGGVSMFAFLFAKAIGARVIATTTSVEKGRTLREYGANSVLDFVGDKNWGETAMRVTNNEGVNHVVEVWVQRL